LQSKFGTSSRFMERSKDRLNEPASADGFFIPRPLPARQPLPAPPSRGQSRRSPVEPR
jgi:hypothetical protein